LTIECDELWSFVANKNQKEWVWLALDRDTQEIVEVAIGARDAATARDLWASLPPVYRQCAVCSSDFLGASACVLPSKRHRPLGKDSGQTSRIERLRQHWQRQQQERAALPLTWQKHGRVFSSEIGTPLPPRNLYRHFERLRALATIPDDLHFHDLRHTALTRLAERGTQPAVVQAIAGHTTPTLALQVYTHAELDALRAAIG
jgi:IS1 family transposase